ncbi:MAG TPA: alpha/beta hydrolase [Ktedonobacteraceae bacterium]
MSKHIIFIHGSGDNGRIWRSQIASLTASPSHVHAIDLPGHGQRPDTLPATVTAQDYARTVYDIMNDELHLRQAIIAGHSLGGAIALSMALTYPQNLQGLILVGTGARLKVAPALLEATRLTPDTARNQLAEWSMLPQHISTTWPAIASDQQSDQPSMLYRDLAACNVFDCMERLYEIQVPTLILCGAADRLTPVKYSEYLHRHIANSTLQIIDQAGHYVMREQPDAVNRSIEQWVQQLPDESL